ncbi:MAG: hypothetical protein EOP07_21120, partial [Proteobacteria bacterium]
MKKTLNALPLTLFTGIWVSSMANAAGRIDNTIAQTETAAPAQTTQGQVPGAAQPAAVQQVPAAQQPAAVQQQQQQQQQRQQPAVRTIERVEPAAIPVAASSKSQDQLEYEA